MIQRFGWGCWRMQRNVTYWGNWRVLSGCWNKCGWSWWTRLPMITWCWCWETWKNRYELQRVWGLIWAIDIRQVVGICGFRRKITIHYWTRDDRLTKGENELLDLAKIFRKHINRNECAATTSRLLGGVGWKPLRSRHGSRTSSGFWWNWIISYRSVGILGEENITITGWLMVTHLPFDLT